MASDVWLDHTYHRSPLLFLLRKLVIVRVVALGREVTGLSANCSGDPRVEMELMDELREDIVAVEREIGYR